MIYFDRNGDEFIPASDDVLRSRRGVFCVCICGDEILVNIEDHAPENPSLPGGGIDEGEGALQAAKREFSEETGMIFPDSLEPQKTFEQDIKLYADDVDEYWDYHQTYFLFNINKGDEIYFEGKRPNPSGFYSFWDHLNDIQASKLHHENKRGLRSLMEL